MAKQPQRKTRRKVNDTNTETAQPRTLEQKLEAAKALVARIEAEIVSEKIKNDIQVGDDVDFNFGRGDSVRTMTGSVAGMVDTDQGRVIAITITDDMGLPDVKRVNIKALTANRTADARRNTDAADPLNAA